MAMNDSVTSHTIKLIDQFSAEAVKIAKAQEQLGASA